VSYAYRLSALKLVSDIELPELMPWGGRSEAPVEVLFRVGKVPPHLEAPDYVTSIFQTKGRDRYLLAWPDNSRVLVENGREVTVQPALGADLTDVRALLMGPVQAVLCHQRGLLPLHASVVGVNARALALAGTSGVGKSTLAAALSSQGHQVMADDICIIDAANGADVFPITARLRLWRDALQHLGIAVDGLPRALSRWDKYLVDCGKAGQTEPRKLGAIVLLSRRACGAVGIERLRGARAVMELQSVVHMRRSARALGLEPAIFTGLTRLAAAGAAVWQLVMPDDPVCLDEAAAMVLAALDG
jgi:hypothetical protein